MSNYIIWKYDYDGESGELLIEIFHESDLQSVQKEFIEMGYIIIRVDYAFDEVFMKVVKKDNE